MIFPQIVLKVLQTKMWSRGIQSLLVVRPCPFRFGKNVCQTFRFPFQQALSRFQDYGSTIDNFSSLKQIVF